MVAIERISEVSGHLFYTKRCNKKLHSLFLPVYMYTFDVGRHTLSLKRKTWGFYYEGDFSLEPQASSFEDPT